VPSLWKYLMLSEIQIPESPPSVASPKLTLSEQAISHLNRSGLLVQYVRELIIAETLAAWERSPTDSISIDIPKVESGEHQNLRLERYKQAHWGHLLKSRFLACQSQLNRVLFSTIEVTDLSLAQELYCRITEQGYSFNKLAITHSNNSTAKLGGVVGPIAPAYLHPLIQQQLKGLEAKQLSPIFRVENHYIFLRLDRKIPAQLNAQIEQQLLDELFESWLEQQIIDRISILQVTDFVPTIEYIPCDVAVSEIPILVAESLAQPLLWRIELEPTAPAASEQISITSSFFLPTQPGDSIGSASFFPPSDPIISIPQSGGYCKGKRSATANAPREDRRPDSIGQKIATFCTGIFTRKRNQLAPH
jgi:hypothetical protein